MRLADVKINLDEKTVSLLAEFGWGGGYQTSRMWHCSSISDARQADISEIHDERLQLSDWEVKALSRSPYVSHMEAAYEMDSANWIIENLANRLGINPDKIKIAEKSGTRLTTGRIAEILLAAAKKTLAAS